jgi:hypothetical protein
LVVAWQAVPGVELAWALVEASGVKLGEAWEVTSDQEQVMALKAAWGVESGQEQVGSGVDGGVGVGKEGGVGGVGG